MPIILSKSLTLGNQSLQLMVNYDPTTNEVGEIKSIWLITHGKQWPVGNLMMQFFEPAINKIIDEIDWREVYREMGEGSDADRISDGAAVITDVFSELGSYFEPPGNYKGKEHSDADCGL